MSEREEMVGDLRVIGPALTPISRAYSGGAPVFAGDISQMPLLSLFNLLTQSRENGRLLLRRGNVERVALIRGGDLGAVGGNGPNDRLGSTLLRSRRVTDAQFEDALRVGREQGMRVGQALISMGLLQAHELFDVIREQVTEICCDCVAWTEGTFFFYRLPPGFDFPPAPPVNLTGLLLEAARRLDELKNARAAVGDDDAEFNLTGRLLDKDEPLPAAHIVYAHLGEPPVAVRDLTRASRLSSFDCLRGIQRLLQLGIILEAPASAPPLPVALNKAQLADIDCVRLGLREIEHAMAFEDATEDFHAAVGRFIDEADAITRFVFEGIKQPSANLDIETLRENMRQIDGPNKALVAQGVLNELLKFCIFQAGEMLSPIFNIALKDRLHTVCGRLQI